MNEIHEVLKCPISKDDEKFTYFNLGKMPLVNNLTLTKDESLTIKKYDLAIQYFPKTKLTCLTHNIDPNLLFSEYTYKSGVVKAFSEHCNEMYSFLNIYLNFKKNDKILDIGGNDGTLLDVFLKKNPELDVLNVDASENICKLSLKKGIPTHYGFWGLETAKKIDKKFKLITSTNVYQHTSPLVDFVEGISYSLDKFGIWCLEFPYWKTNMETNQYDQIYHEHVYYYLIEPLKMLFEKFNLKIIKAVKYPIHGGSLRLLITHKNELNDSWASCDTVETLLKEEDLITSDYYKNWGIKIKGHIENCRNFLVDIKNRKNNIVGFGAAAKGCIFLNSAKIDYTILDAVIDDTDLKQNKYIPGTGIKIHNRDYLKENKVDYILILAHNFKDVIIDDIRKTYNDVKFIVLFPEPTII